MRRYRGARLSRAGRPAASPGRATLLLVAGLLSGLLVSLSVLQNVRVGHEAGLALEAEHLQVSLRSVFSAWETVIRAYTDLAARGLLAEGELIEHLEDQRILDHFKGFFWVGMSGGGRQAVTAADDSMEKLRRLVLDDPAVRATIHRAQQTDALTLSPPLDLPEVCPGKTLIATRHVGPLATPPTGLGGLLPGRWVHAAICADEFFSRHFENRRVDYDLSIHFADGGAPIYEQRTIGGGSLVTLANVEHSFDAGGATWSIRLASLPFPFGREVALPLYLFLGAIGASLLLRGLSRAEARERVLAEEMLQNFRVGLKQSAFLAEASRVLASKTDVEPVLEAIAERAVPLLGAGCGICLLEGRHHVRIHVAHASEEVQAELRRRYADAPLHVPGFHSLLLELDRQNLKRVPEHLFESRLIASSPAELRDELRATLRWCVIVPMMARGRAIGAVVVRTWKDMRYGPKELALIHDFASRVGLALDNSRLLQRSREAIQIRDEFLSIASHELLTPLTALQANVQSLMRQRRQGEPVSPERLERGLEIADRQVQRLTRLVRELLDVSRIESGRGRLDPEPFDLSGLVEELVVRYREEAERHGSEMHVDAPPGATGVWDRDRLEQVITNLISNAIKYGNARPIHVEVGSDASTAWVAVRDRGIGIAPERLPTIFQRFERAAPGSGYGGLGLGLYIAQQITEAHGGRIAVSSTPGKGSCFTLILRRDAVPSAASHEGRVEGPGQGTERRLGDQAADPEA